MKLQLDVCSPEPYRSVVPASDDLVSVNVYCTDNSVVPGQTIMGIPLSPRELAEIPYARLPALPAAYYQITIGVYVQFHGIRHAPHRLRAFVVSVITVNDVQGRSIVYMQLRIECHAEYHVTGASRSLHDRGYASRSLTAI